jgi:hypothetical protein
MLLNAYLDGPSILGKEIGLGAILGKSQFQLVACIREIEGDDRPGSMVLVVVKKPSLSSTGYS